MTTTTRPRMDMATRYKITKIMEEAIEVLPDGFCRYKNGTNDAQIAEQFGVSDQSIRKTRQKLFGLLKVAKLPEPKTLEERVEVLEAHVLNLRKELGLLS